MKKNFFSFCIMLSVVFSGHAQVQSPSEFLPSYGKQITHYHQVENYFKQLTAEKKDKTTGRWSKFRTRNEKLDLRSVLKFTEELKNDKNLANTAVTVMHLEEDEEDE